MCLNRENRRALKKKLRDKGSRTLAADVLESLGNEIDKKIRDGDLVILNVDQIIARKDYDQFASQTVPASDSDLEQFRKLFQEMRAELQDNDCGQWSAEARQWALDMGLITGNGTVINGEPNYMWQDLVTREQFVTVLYRLAQIMGSPA